MRRRTCTDCGVSDFLEVVREFCIICESTERCESCHRAHNRRGVHVGVVLVHRGGKEGSVFMRAEEQRAEEPAA